MTIEWALELISKRFSNTSNQLSNIMILSHSRGVRKS